MNLAEYEQKWNAFSWEIAEAADSFFALSACTEWQEATISRVETGPPLLASPHMSAVMVFINSIAAHFFISICRIREPDRTTLSLPILFRDAKTLASFDSKQESSIHALLNKTKNPFEKIKKVRGMAVAHLQKPESPFAIMKREKITKVMVHTYLEDCFSLYSLLGNPIVGSRVSGLDQHKQTQDSVRKALECLCPL